MKYLSKLTQSGETTINLPNLVCTKIGEGSIKPYSFPKKTIDNDLDIKILSGGTVLTENEPLSFTAYNDDFTLNFYDYNTDEEIEDIIDSFGLHFQYSYNKEEWFDWDSETRNITIENGSTVYLKGNNPNGINSEDKWIYFHFEENEGNNGGFVECHGNIMSLLGKYEKDIPCEYCFASMFYQCTSLTTAPELPATSLTEHCYAQMFDGCTSLTTAPELSATTLANSCYYMMFDGCTALVNAPELPATTLTDSCYDSMFEGCTSLVTAPAELPATIFAIDCYSYMFHGCSSLTTAPVLPATTLSDSCYDSMFEGCTSLSSVTCLAESGINENYSTTNWLKNVSANGVFTKSANATWPIGANGIPNGWTVQTAS